MLECVPSSPVLSALCFGCVRLGLFWGTAEGGRRYVGFPLRCEREAAGFDSIQRQPQHLRCLLGRVEGRIGCIRIGG